MFWLRSKKIKFSLSTLTKVLDLEVSIAIRYQYGPRSEIIVDPDHESVLSKVRNQCGPRSEAIVDPDQKSVDPDQKSVLTQIRNQCRHRSDCSIANCLSATC